MSRDAANHVEPNGMHNLQSQIYETVTTIRARYGSSPRVGIILGSGWGGVADRISLEASFDYEELSHFPRSTAIGHRGRLVFGDYSGVPVVVMQGRFHLYEGYTAKQVTLPVRVIKALGAGLLIVSNAAGGLDPRYRAGDVMVISDHINLMSRNPLLGINDDTLGQRFPDMSAPYQPDYINSAMAISRRENIIAHCGIYVGMLGPTYETRAEYRLLRQIGGDAVGMSTVPEVIAAVHAGLPVLGLSIISNVASPDALSPTSGDEVVSVVQSASERAAKIVTGVIETEFA